MASVGVAPNKFLAKLASDQEKPDGLTLLADPGLQGFLDQLPIERMWGVGRKGAPKLRDAGFRHFRDLRLANVDQLSALIGKHGAERLMRLARGIDDRPVNPVREEKSISNETTLDEDLRTAGACHEVLLRLALKVAARLRRAERAGRTIQVKIRTSGFRTYTRSRTLDSPAASDRVVSTVSRDLFDRWWRELGPAPIRLLGVGVNQLAEASQSSLFESPVDPLDTLGDRVRERFGDASLMPARLVPDADDEGVPE